MCLWKNKNVIFKVCRLIMTCISRFCCKCKIRKKIWLLYCLVFYQKFNEATLSLLPLYFCCRWLENVQTCEWFLDIWPDTIKFETEKYPQTKSSFVVLSNMNDILFPVKLHIFVSVLKDIDILSETI